MIRNAQYTCPECGAIGASPEDAYIPSCYVCSKDGKSAQMKRSHNGKIIEHPVELFRMYGLSASHHYADDTTREWALADSQKALALKVFDDNPKYQWDMRVAASNFLWSLDLERPR